jgi:hypothetical protein
LRRDHARPAVARPHIDLRDHEDSRYKRLTAEETQSPLGLRPHPSSPVCIGGRVHVTQSLGGAIQDQLDGVQRDSYLG